MVKTIARLIKWYLCGMVALPILFAAFDGAYIGFSNRRSLSLVLEPLVIKIVGSYDSLLGTIPLYFLLSILGGVIGVAIGLIRQRTAKKTRI